MKATHFEFRYRVAIIAALYTLGFVLPWYWINDFAGSRTWLVLPLLLARTGWSSLSNATLFVTVLALIAGTVGTLLRVWGTAHIGAATMTSTSMLGGQVVATGPYRHLRNPLYLGTWLLTVPITLLMPLAGTVFVFVTLSILLVRIIRGEEAHLRAQPGESYSAYSARVPRLIPAWLPAVPSGSARPQWMQALAAESFAVGYTLCFAFWAWRYNVPLLMECMLVCFGASLIFQAMGRPGKTTQG